MDRRNHRFSPDGSGLSCQDCTSPKANAVHHVTQASGPGEGPRGGVTCVAPIDEKRLNAQGRLIWRYMADGQWHTLDEVETATRGVPQQSISARLRDFRKKEYGAHEVETRRLSTGTWEYRLLVKETATTH